MAFKSRLSARLAEDNQALYLGREDGVDLLTHRIGSVERPSIHPLRAPDGDGELTEDRPSHHPWQRGLYTGFNIVNGIGFWQDRPEDGTFDPAIVAGPDVDDHVVQWSLENPWIAPGGIPLLVERQDWTLHDEGTTYDLDLDWTLQAKVDVVIGQHMAGGLFLRMPYTEETGGVALNSEGHQNGAAEKQRARWVVVSMPIAGRDDWGGVALMDHPGNPAFPVTWRVDNELGVSPSRCIDESWTIPAGTVERYRFRLHVFSGSIDAAQLHDRWERFASSGPGTSS